MIKTNHFTLKQVISVKYQFLKNRENIENRAKQQILKKNVLFLFVIMLLNIKLTDILETSHQYTKNLPLAFSIGILFIYEIYTIIPFPIDNISFTSYFLNLINILNGLLLNNNINLDSVVHLAINPTIADTTISSFTQIEAIGQGLYTYGGSWLIIISIILLLAMVAPIFITKPKKINN